MYQNYPDDIEFVSDNEKAVKVLNTIDAEGKTVCTLLAVGSGKAVITAKAKAGNVGRNVIVYVSSENLKLDMSDSDGTKITSGSNASVYIKKETTYTYSLSETLANKELSVDNSDESVVKVSAYSGSGKVVFKPLKVGVAKVLIYPKVGDKKNGITYTVQVNSDVSVIWLSGKKIPEGKTESVFSYMMNSLNQKITEATENSYKSFTDNVIEFKSDSPDNVSVDKYGNVTVKKYSEKKTNVVITCNVYEGNNLIKTASTTVSIQKPQVKSVNVTGSMSIKVGQNAKYKVSVNPVTGEYTGMRVTLVSGSSNTASWQLSSNYKELSVKGVSAGTVILEIQALNYGDVLASKRIRITVSKSAAKTVAKVKWSKCKGAKKKVSLKWKKVSGATGYEIQISQKKKSGFKKVKVINSGKKFKCTISRLKKKKYYFKIRAFVREKNGSTRYGRWSSVKMLRSK